MAPVRTYTRRARLLGSAAILAIAITAAAFALAGSQSACAGENCLSDHENCSQSYLQANGLEGYHCCHDQQCQAGTINPDVLVCRF